LQAGLGQHDASTGNWSSLRNGTEARAEVAACVADLCFAALEVRELGSHCLLPDLQALAIGQQRADFGDRESRPLPGLS
jgi:hypothetical protein